MTVLTNILASLLIAALVIVAMAFWGAPTWACIGIGALVYLHEVKHPMKGARR